MIIIFCSSLASAASYLHNKGDKEIIFARPRNLHTFWRFSLFFSLVRVNKAKDGVI